MTALIRSREASLLAIIGALTGAISLYQPAFFTAETLSDLLTDTAVLFMMAIAQMMVILTRGIDLSVAANLALSGMVAATLSKFHPGLPLLVFILAGIGIGLVQGAINGALIAFLGIPPIVVTLGTLAIFRGMIYVIGRGDQVKSYEMGEAFQAFPKATLLGLTSGVWIAAIVALLAWLFLTMSRTGRALYAIGGNPVAARYCGIDIRRHELLVYVISGAMSGLCGYLWVARYGIAYTEIATGYELTVIAACMIGGVSIAGGVGSIGGTLLGALFLGVIVNALPVMQISPFWQMAVSGFVILAAVIVNARVERRPAKLILPEARRAGGSA